MIASVRRWSPPRMLSFALRREKGSKRNEKSVKEPQPGILESWQLALERQANLVIRNLD